MLFVWFHCLDIWSIILIAYSLAADVRRYRSGRQWLLTRCCLLHCWLPFPGCPPSYQVAGSGKNKTDPFSLSSVSDFFENSPASARLFKKNITVGVCAGKHRPPCHVNFSLILRAWSRIFLSMVFTLSLHTDVVHSICKNHLLKQTFLLVHVCGWCKPCNYVPVTHTLSRRSLRSGLLESQDSSVVRSTWCNWAF